MVSFVAMDSMQFRLSSRYHRFVFPCPFRICDLVWQWFILPNGFPIRFDSIPSQFSQYHRSVLPCPFAFVIRGNESFIPNGFHLIRFRLSSRYHRFALPCPFAFSVTMELHSPQWIPFNSIPSQFSLPSICPP